MLASSDRAFSAQRAAPSSSKTARASPRLFAGCRLLLRPALRRPEGEEGARSLERARDARVLCKRLLELGERYVVVPAGGGQQTAAAGSGRERRGSVEGSPLLLEPVEQSPCLVRSPEGDERFDLVGDEADRARLADSGCEEPLTLGREQPAQPRSAGRARARVRRAPRRCGSWRPPSLAPRRTPVPAPRRRGIPLRPNEARTSARVASEYACIGRWPVCSASSDAFSATCVASSSARRDTPPARAARGPSGPSPRHRARRRRRGSHAKDWGCLWRVGPEGEDALVEGRRRKHTPVGGPARSARRRSARSPPPPGVRPGTPGGPEDRATRPAGPLRANVPRARRRGRQAGRPPRCLSRR